MVSAKIAPSSSVAARQACARPGPALYAVVARGFGNAFPKRRWIAQRKIVSSLCALRGVDRTVVQADAARVFGGEKQAIVVEAPHDIRPLPNRFGAQIERAKREHTLHGVALAERRDGGGINLDRLAYRHDRGAYRLRGQKTVKMVLGRK